MGWEVWGLLCSESSFHTNEHFSFKIIYLLKFLFFSPVGEKCIFCKTVFQNPVV